MPSARAAGPPRSNSQYQTLNTIMFVVQIAAPVRSRVSGVRIPKPFTRSTMSRPAEIALPMLITASSANATGRSRREFASTRIGLTTSTTRSSTEASPGTNQRGWFATRVGSTEINPMATAMVTVTGIRDSTRVTSRHAGRATPPTARIASLPGRSTGPRSRSS